MTIEEQQLAEIVSLLREISGKLDQANKALGVIANNSGTTW